MAEANKPNSINNLKAMFEQGGNKQPDLKPVPKKLDTSKTFGA